MTTRRAAVSPRADWCAYVLAAVPGALLAVLHGIGVVSERTALLLFVPSFIGLNLAHMASAWGRAYLDDRGWRTAPVERVVIPAVLVVASLTLEAIGMVALLLAAQYWLSVHHGAMQNYGILRTTHRRAGRKLDEGGLRLDQAACALLPLGALTYRARAVCQKYDGASLPVPPSWLVTLLVSAGVVALGAYLLRELAAARRGEAVDPLGVVLVVTTNALWSGLIIGLSHPALPLYAIASGHYIQQLYFVWRFESRRGGFEALPARARALFAPPARLGYLVGATATGGLVVLLLTLAAVAARAAAGAAGLRGAAVLDVPPWVAAMIGVNLSHYWLEHRIWRFRGARGTAPESAAGAAPVTP